MSSAVVITGKKPFLGLNLGWGAEVKKVFDLKGNIVVEERTLIAWDDVTIPYGKYEVLVRCYINNIYGYRSYILNAEASHKYTLECVPGRVSDDPKVILAEKSKINIHNE